MPSLFKHLSTLIAALVICPFDASAIGIGIDTGCRIQGELGNFTTGIDPCVSVHEFTVDHGLLSSGEQIAGVNSALTKFELDSAWQSNLDIFPSRAGLYTTYAARGNFGTVGVRTNSAAAGTLSTSGYAIAQSNAQVYFMDTILIRSPTLASGSVVDIDFDYHLDGRAGAAVSANNTSVYSTLNGTFTIQDNLGRYPLSTTFCVGEYQVADCVGVGIGGRSPDFRIDSHGIVSLQIGVEYLFTSSLVAQSYATLDLRSFSADPIDVLRGGSSRMDAFNTLNSFLTATSRDYEIVSGSGHDYSLVAAVPEPATGILMLAGLVAMGAARSRRRSTLGI